MRSYANRCDAKRCDAMRCDTMRSYAMRCDAAPAAPAAPAAHAAPAAPATQTHEAMNSNDMKRVATHGARTYNSLYDRQTN